MSKVTYDSKCWDLAVMFLSDIPEKDTHENRYLLAAAVQRTVEDVIEYQLKPNSLSPVPSSQKPRPKSDRGSK